MGAVFPLSAVTVLLCMSFANAETLIAKRTIRSQTILSAADLEVTNQDTVGALRSLSDAVGLEARVVLYAGRPIKASDIGRAAIIERNQIVTLIYHRGGLSIVTEARSLGRAGVGDRLRVMNLVSRHTVSGRVTEDGSVSVGEKTTRNSN